MSQTPKTSTPAVRIPASPGGSNATLDQLVQKIRKEALIQPGEYLKHSRVPAGGE